MTKTTTAMLAMALLVAGLAMADDHGTEDIAGSSVSFDSYLLVSPTELMLNFSATQVTSDATWFDRVELNLPAAWTITALSSTDFNVTGGIGTSTASFTFDDYPCSGFGIDCDPPCVLTVTVDPGGVLDSQTVTWMIEGDTWGDDPPAVVCSSGDPCAHDVCYDTLGIDQTGTDITTGPVPVEIQSFSVE